MRIKRLDNSVISRIAAGEVVENPSSVVRELIENSIDANATNISILVEGGGKKTIVVKDNGIGMTKDEIPLAVNRFTTSKISTLEDLKTIKTLGFRGEALYAIASVSNLYITSKTSDDELAWKAKFKDTKLVELVPVNHPTGTTVEVLDLFYNYPARRHFLSADHVEARRCIETVARYCLAHPEIAFKLVVDGNVIYDLEVAQDVQSRIMDIFGENWVNEMTWVEKKYGDLLKVYGYVSLPRYLSERPLVQDIFVNGRRVIDDTLRKAIHRAYEIHGKYPQFLIFIEIRPDRIDFNIHPQKLQVKFHRSVHIFEKVMTAVKEAVKEHLSIVKPAMHLLEIKPAPSRDIKQLELGEMLHRAEISSNHHAESTEISQEKLMAVPLFQMHKTYIVAKIHEGLVIVDQHVAHERVLYERLLSRERNTKMLLFPIMLDLPHWALKWIDSNLSVLESSGFIVEKLSGNTYVLKGIPDVFRNFEKNDFLSIIDEIRNERRVKDPTKSVLKTIACRAAVKAGDPLSEAEMQELLEQLFSTENPFQCPHGRPIFITITIDELAKMFERK